MTTIDPLTGLLSLQSFSEFYRTNINDKTQTDRWFIALFDIDSLRYINYHFGFLVADQMIQDIADILRTETEGLNVFLFRVRGDKFVLMTREIPEDELISLLKEIQETIFEKKFPFRGHPDQIKDRCTVSIIVSSLSPTNIIGEPGLVLAKLLDHLDESKNNVQPQCFQLFIVVTVTLNLSSKGTSSETP